MMNDFILHPAGKLSQVLGGLTVEDFTLIASIINTCFIFEGLKVGAA